MNGLIEVEVKCVSCNLPAQNHIRLRKSDLAYITHLITSDSSVKKFINDFESRAAFILVVSGGTHKRFPSFGFDGRSCRKAILQWTRALAALSAGQSNGDQ
jgi:hypothetical protein